MHKTNNIFVSGLFSKNRDIFIRLYDQYYTPLCKYAFKYVRNIESAEDIVQDTFLKIWNLKKELREDVNITSYLYRAVRNSCIDFIETKVKEESLRKNLLLNAKLLEQESAEEIDRAEEITNNVAKLIQKIPKRSRTVFEMSRYHGLKHREIASQLDITVKGVEYHISTALRFLKKELIKHKEEI